MSDLRTDLADQIAALVDPYEHSEEYTLRPATPDGRHPAEIRVHRVKFPPLLVQLATAKSPSTSTESGARGYESNPSARLDAIDRLTAIEDGATDLLAALDVPLRGDTTANIRALAGIDMDNRQLRDTISTVRRWVTWARVVTGWETPPMSPNVRCLACNRLGTLRVRVDPLHAYCVACEAAWDETNSGLLAAAIRDAEKTPPAVVEPPIVWVNPGEHGGAPMIRTVPVEVVACALQAGQTVEIVANIHYLTRADVLAACWYLGRYSRSWRTALHQWSRAVEHAMETGSYDEIPDPPIGRTKRLRALASA